jgi:hypothetical protein
MSNCVKEKQTSIVHLTLVSIHRVVIGPFREKIRAVARRTAGYGRPAYDQDLYCIGELSEVR